MKCLSRVTCAALLGWMAFSMASVRPAAAQTAGEYVVQPGDTLLAIAFQFGTTASALQATNDLKNPDALQIGQTLRIPTGQGASASEATTTHIIQSGDTLLAIGAKYGVSIGDLTRANSIAESTLLQIGQTLVIPISGKAAASAPVELIPLVPIPAPAEAPPSAEQPTAEQPLPAPTAIPLPAETASGVDTELETIRTQLLDIHNQQRLASGLQPIVYSLMLQAAAQGQAEDCATRGSCSHFGSDGSRSSQRMARAGFGGQITGENWVWAHSAAQAWQYWFVNEAADQGPHWKNILSPRYVEVGFGVVRAKGGYYMIANFGG